MELRQRFLNCRGTSRHSRACSHCSGPPGHRASRNSGPPGLRASFINCVILPYGLPDFQASQVLVAVVIVRSNTIHCCPYHWLKEGHHSVIMTRSRERRPRNSDDEEWSARLRKRLLIVQAIKKTCEYQTPWVVNGVPLPVTPNPRDRDCSKRQWESKVQDWRIQIRLHREVSLPPPPDVSSW